MKRIIVSDCTLQKMAKQDTNLLFREKLSIAMATEGYGADRIELAPITNAKGDGIIYRTIAESVSGCVIAVPAGPSKAEIEEAYGCIKNAVKPCIQIALPVSTVQMEYIYHVKAEKMAPKIQELVSYAKSLCDEVEFIALDASRADEAFLAQAVKTAAEAGATAVTICDDAGIMLPEEYAAMTAKVVAAVSVPVYVECSNQMHMASANACAAIAAGASGVKTCISGKDTLKIGSFADAMAVKAEKLGVQTNLKSTEIYRDIESIKKIHQEPDNAAAGENASKDIFIDGESSLSDVTEAVKVLGYDLSDADYGAVYDEAKKICRSKSCIGRKELEAIVATEANQVPSTYHLESYLTTSGNLTSSVAQVVLKTAEDTISGVAGGDGPIDAAFRAIEQSLGHHYELDLFQIDAVTEGKEALGSAIIRLRSNSGKVYSGNGVSTDIIGACIRAYLNALNKLVFEEK